MQRRKTIPASNPQREVLDDLRNYVERNFQADKYAAEHFGFSAGHLSLMLAGRKRIPERVCRMLGYELRWVKSAADQTDAPHRPAVAVDAPVGRGRMRWI